MEGAGSLCTFLGWRSEHHEISRWSRPSETLEVRRHQAKREREVREEADPLAQPTRSGTVEGAPDMPCCARFGGLPCGVRRGSPAPDASARSRPADPAKRDGGRRAAEIVEDIAFATDTERPHGAMCVDMDAPPPTICGRSRRAAEPVSVSADDERERPQTPPDAPVTLLFRARAQSPALLRWHVLPAHHSPHRFKVSALWRGSR